MSEPKAPRKTAIIVGAGAGGIATAARLARAGLQVTVLEKNEHTGGRCSNLRHGAYRFDQGPSLLLLPRLFREAFHDLDTSLEAEGVDLLRCPGGANYDVWFPDGDRFRQSADLALTKAQIERLEGPQGFERYLAWMAEAHRHYELSQEHVLHRNFTSVLDLLRVRFLAAALRLHPFESIWRRAGRYFATEKLRRVFTFATMYMGMSPFDAPATYSLLQYAEQAEGVWYPRGGFHEVLRALAGVGQRLGARYRLGCPVARILTDGGGGDDSEGEAEAARGVVLENGEVLRADVVVVNADLVYAYSNLFPATAETESYARSLRARRASCSSLSFYWSLSEKVPELSTHNIFLADKYRGSFDAIFRDQSLPAEPSFYVNVPSRVDPSAAPERGDAVIALVPVGHLRGSRGHFEGDGEGREGLPADDEEEWAKLVDRAREAVLSVVRERTGCKPLKELIQHEMVNTPLTWQDKFNLDKGAILGLSHDFFNVLAFRPRTRAKGLKNAYFVGASTHPGTGVPIVLAGAKITAEQVLEDLGLEVPWREKELCEQDRVVVQDGSTHRLDKVQELLWTVEDAAIVLGGLLVSGFMLAYLFPSGHDTLLVSGGVLLTACTLAYLLSSESRFGGDW